MPMEVPPNSDWCTGGGWTVHYGPQFPKQLLAIVLDWASHEHQKFVGPGPSCCPLLREEIK
jgi:hypothetical protein